MGGVSKDRAIRRANRSSRLAGLPPEPDELAVIEDLANGSIDRVVTRRMGRPRGRPILGSSGLLLRFPHGVDQVLDFLPPTARETPVRIDDDYPVRLVAIGVLGRELCGSFLAVETQQLD